MENVSKSTVLVVSRSYTAGLSVVRSLGAAGYTVDLVSSTGSYGNAALVATSKYVRDFTKVVSKKSSGDEELVNALISWAGKYNEKIVLVPTDKYTTSVLDNNRTALEEFYVMPSIGLHGSLEEYGSKTLQMALAEQAGLTVPFEWVLESFEDPEIPEDMVYPCVCRPLEDTNIKKRRAVCTDEYELKEHIEYLRRRVPGCTVAVREYYEVDNVITVAGICRDQEVYCPAYMKSTNVAQYKSRSTLTGELHDIDDLGGLKESIFKLLRSLHYTGVFNLKLRVDEDKIYFDKLMFNCGRQNFVYFKSGANLLDSLVKALLGEDFIPENKELQFGTTFINEKAAWEDYIRGYITKRELDEALRTADVCLISSKDDPAPGKVFSKMMKEAAVKSRFVQFKRNIKRYIRRTVVPKLRKLKYRILGYPQAKPENKRQYDAEKPRVLVAGRNYCSNLCLARAFGQAGYEVEVLRIFQVRPKRKNLMRFLKPDAYSKYVKAYHVCLSKKKSRRIVNKLVKIANRRQKMLLIPADDLVANVTDEYLKRLLKYYVIPNVNETPNAINHLMSKEVQKDLAEAAGLPIINSCVIKTFKGEFEIPESVKYPCFIKPNISKNGLKSRMRRCDTEEELREVLTEYSRKVDIEMLVQDFVEIGKEYSILGVSTKDGVIGPGFFGAEEGGHDSRRGVALTGKVVPVSRNQQLIDDIIKFIGTMNYEGLYDVDLIETKDGVMYFVEMNMRFGGSGYAITASGCNLPGMFADYMLMGKPIDMTAEIVETGKSFVSEKIMIEEYSGGFLTFKEVMEHMKKADIHFIKDAEDKKPYRHFRRYYFFAALMKFSYWWKARREGKK